MRSAMNMFRQVPAIWWSLRAARAQLKRSLAHGLDLHPLAQRPGRMLQDGQAQALADTVFAVGRRMRGCACLPQSIALANLLRDRGVAASVVLGASKAQGRFAAHAWVESPLGRFDPSPGATDQFTPLERFSGRPS